MQVSVFGVFDVSQPPVRASASAIQTENRQCIPSPLPRLFDAWAVLSGQCVVISSELLGVSVTVDLGFGRHCVLLCDEETSDLKKLVGLSAG